MNVGPDERAVAAAIGQALGEPRSDELDVLHGRLARRADAEGVLDLTYRTVDSPFGALLVVASAAGIVQIAFEREGHDAVLASLAAALGPRILASGLRTDAAARQLEEYFAGRRRSFDVPVDLRLVGGFRRTVLDHLVGVAYGTTATYTALAEASGNPKAVRAVGTACARNPVPVVVPCHRVVRSDGTIGDYRGGPEMKAALLAMEAGA